MEYEFYCWPPQQPVMFQPGSEVYVNLHSDKDTGHAVVLTHPRLCTKPGVEAASVATEPNPAARCHGPTPGTSMMQPDGPAAALQVALQHGQHAPATTAHEPHELSAGHLAGVAVQAGPPDSATVQGDTKASKGLKARCKVQYVCCGRQYHYASASRLTKRYRCPGRHRIIICAKTMEYRALARSQVCWADHVVELGSSYGHCTAILHQYAASVLGIEMSDEAIAGSRVSFPHVRFAQLDVLLHPQEMLDMMKGAQVVFVDIGGDRHVPALVRCLMHIMERAQPELIVVKSERLAALAKQRLAEYSKQQQPQVLGAAGPAAPFEPNLSAAAECCNGAGARDQVPVVHQSEVQIPVRGGAGANGAAKHVVEERCRPPAAAAGVQQAAACRKIMGGNQVPYLEAERATTLQASAAAMKDVIDVQQILSVTHAACRCSREAVRWRGKTATLQNGGTAAIEHAKLAACVLPELPTEALQQFNRLRISETAENIGSLTPAQDVATDSNQDAVWAATCEELGVSTKEVCEFAQTANLAPEAAVRLLLLWRHPAVQAAQAQQPEGLLPNGRAWWAELVEQHACRARPLKDPVSGALQPWPWYTKARAKGFAAVNCLRLPWKETEAGVPICRWFNYGDCEQGGACKFDHGCCHHCGAEGHVAKHCPLC